MSTPEGQPSNVARDASQIGVQGNNADVDTIIFGGVQLTVGPDALPEDMYRAGVNNLLSGNPPAARTLIWDAMMRDYAHSEVVFHWLIAMLSGRAMKQFSTQEEAQLNSARVRFAQTGPGSWADGIRLIYRLLGTVLSPDKDRSGPATGTTSMQALVDQFDSLEPQQRSMIRPHLELFLTGPLQNERWREALELARSRQHENDRYGRAWMFFHPDPAKVNLLPPEPEQITAAHRLGLRVSAWGLAVVAIYLCVELLLHGAVVGFLAVLVALGAGTIAATADLELRFLAGQRLKDQQVQATAQSASGTPAGETAVGVHKLYQRYIGKYVPDPGERERWETATAGIRQFQENELAQLCRRNGVAPTKVAWLIRFQLRELKRSWQQGTLHEYRQKLVPEPGTEGKRAAALAVLVAGGAVASFELGAYPLADMADIAGLLIAFWLWRSWLRVNSERRRYAADRKAHDQRQEALDKEYARWNQKLRARPDDAEMASWLAQDRTVLLGQLLGHYGLDRSGLMAHALLERNGVAARRAQVEEGPWRYQHYRLRVLLLAGDGVREIRVGLDFLTGILTMRERTSYPYGSIVSAYVKRDRDTHVFTFTLTAGDPITFRVPDVIPAQTQQDHDTGPAEITGDTDEAAEETAPDVTSVADVLHLLEKITGEGPTILRNRSPARVATHSS